jgi:hypothetical protein
MREKTICNKKKNFFSYQNFAKIHLAAPRFNVDLQITDRQNVDNMTENIDFILPRLTSPAGARCPAGVR